MSTAHRATEAPSLPPVGWVAACTAAEAIGMTAAAGAARLAHAWAGDAPTTATRLGALAVVVAGGLIEGAALGWFQGRSLETALPGFAATRWALLTLAVAGVGWAVASAPAALSTDDGGTQPPWFLIVVGALALGAALGALLGTVQARVLRGHVRHPWRWVTVSACAWSPAMAVIFVGASAPGERWPIVAVVLLGTATGTLAGATLGLLSGWLMPAVAGVGIRDRLVLAFYRAGLFARQLAVLRVRGVVTGRILELPVQYAADDDGLVVVPGHPASKRWWRNLLVPAEVGVQRGGRSSLAVGVVLRDGDPGYAAARRCYQHRWPSARLGAGDPVVRLTFPSPDVEAGPLRAGAQRSSTGG